MANATCHCRKIHMVRSMSTLQHLVIITELRDGSIMFCFGDEADASSSSSAAADAAMAAGISDKPAAEAATAGQEVSDVAGSNAAAPESTVTAAAEGDAPAQQAAQVTAAAEVSSSDDDPHTEEADAGGSQSQSVDKAQLHDLKVDFSEFRSPSVSTARRHACRAELGIVSCGVNGGNSAPILPGRICPMLSGSGTLMSSARCIARR